MVWVSLSPPQAASSMAGISARVLNCFMGHPSSELERDGAAEYMHITVGSYLGFVTAVIHQGKVTFFQFLVLIAQVQTDRVSKPAGAVVSGAYAQPNHDLVGVQVVDVRVTGGLEGRLFIRQPAAQCEVLVNLVLRTHARNQDVVKVDLRAGYAILHTDRVAIKDITELGPVLLLQAATHAPAVTGILQAGHERFRLERVDGGDRQRQARCGNGLGNDDVGVHRGGGRRLGTVGEGSLPAIQEAAVVRAEGTAKIDAGAQNGFHGWLGVYRQTLAAGLTPEGRHRVQLSGGIQRNPYRHPGRDTAPDRRRRPQVQEQGLFAILQKLPGFRRLGLKRQHLFSVFLNAGNKAQVDRMLETSERDRKST